MCRLDNDGVVTDECILGLSDELIQATFGAGMKGVKPENVPLIEELILSTLKKAAVEGMLSMGY